MKKYLIIYHQEDNDGVLSAALMKHYLLEELEVDKTDIDVLPSTYNSLSKIQESGTYKKWPSEYSHIVMTDISFNDPNMMAWLKENFNENFTWIDHHAPIIRESIRMKFDDVNGIRRTDHSAIYNMWIYLYDPFCQNEIPFVIKMLSAWDSWTYEAEGIDAEFCRMFNQGFTLESGLSLNWYVDNMPIIINCDMNSILLSNTYAKGKEFCIKADDENKKLIDTTGDKEWTVNGIPAIMVVTNGQTSSYMFKSVQVENHTENDIRVGAVFKHCKDGKWTLSIYNIYDFKGDKNNPEYFHCGEYLKSKYNGGGHEGAAGCTIDIDKFYLMMKSKKI